MSDIRIVDIDFEDLVGVRQVARELGITEQKARVLMSEQAIKSVRVNGFYTKRNLLERYKEQRAEL